MMWTCGIYVAFEGHIFSWHIFCSSLLNMLYFIYFSRYVQECEVCMKTAVEVQ